MRVPMYVAAAIGIVAAAPETARAVLVSATSVLLECLPFLTLSVVLAPLLRRFSHALSAFAGCGCGRAPGALSLPAAIATSFLFGPAVAVARFAAGLLAWRLQPRYEADHEASLLTELQRLAPSGLLCSVVVTALPATHYELAPAWLLFVGGAITGACASPCALGGVALASSLYAHAPLASYGLLCTTGFPISFSRLRARSSALFTALPSSIRACRFHFWQPQSSARTIALPLAMLVAVAIGAPQPTYTATETTLTDLYPGERLSFTGSYTHGTLVRYAITCCRADAAPVSVRLAKPLRERDGAWIAASGIVVRIGAMLALQIKTARTIAPPADPFLYR